MIGNNLEAEQLLEEANVRISILEQQRNSALNQVLNALTDFQLLSGRFEHLQAAFGKLVAENAQLALQLNTQAEELVRLKAPRLRKRKTDG